MGDIKHGDANVHWAEKTFGNGKSRGITVKYKEGAKPAQSYKMTPNPHDDPWYNKNQGKFYDEAATELAMLLVASGATAAARSFPRYGKKIKVHNVEYTLSGS